MSCEGSLKGGERMLKNIIIDAVNYRVEETEEVIIHEGKECGAIVEYGKALITIRKDENIGEGLKPKLLMHEIIHALLHERGMDDAAEDETLVDELASGLVNLIRQNPQLINFITNTEMTKTIQDTSENKVARMSKKIIEECQKQKFTVEEVRNLCDNLLFEVSKKQENFEKLLF